jgi:Fe-S-cluster containining protein
MPNKFAAGFAFHFDAAACATCGGRCCRGAPGQVWVDAAEIEAIAAHLEISGIEFRRDYARRVDGRWALREVALAANDRPCIFFDLERSCCTIYPVRPRQCARFPFWERFRHDPAAAAEECPGVRPR